MTVDEIRTLYRYNEWAHGRLFGAADALPAESFERDLGGSFRSLRELLAHVVSAEWIWLERWRGVSPAAVPGWAVSGDAPTLAARLAEVELERRAFLDTLSAGALASRIAVRYLSGAEANLVLGDALVHVVNHSTYHRGQVATMLRQLGAVPPPTDYIVFRTGFDSGGIDGR